MIAVQRGRWREAEQESLRASAILRKQCTGVAWERTSVERNLAFALLHQGRLKELASLVPRLLREARECGDLYAEVALSTSSLVSVLLAADQPERAREESQAAIARWSREGFHLQHLYKLLLDVQIDCYVGDVGGAYRRVVELDPRVRRSMLLRFQLLRIFYLAMRSRVTAACAASAQGEARARMLTSASRDARALMREGLTCATAFGRLTQAIIAWSAGDRERGLEELAAAERGLEEADMMLSVAITRWRRGSLVGGAEGRALIVSAEEAMHAEGIAVPYRLVDAHAPGFLFR